MPHRTASLCVLVSVLVACGGRTPFIGTGTDGGSNQNQNTNQNGNGNAGECDVPEDCTVAWHADTCCACPVAVSREDLAADPCLIPIEQSAIPAECDPGCPPMECIPCASSAWTATCDQGACGFDEGRCAADEDCGVAVRVDDCCQAAFPASQDDLSACVVPWTTTWPEVPPLCQEQWPEHCDLVDCWYQPPASRATICGPTGCEYASECWDPLDCIAVLNGRSCCPCPEAYPESMLGRDPCVVREAETFPAACVPEGCDPGFCGPCRTDTWLECSPSGTLGQCTLVYAAYN